MSKTVLFFSICFIIICNIQCTKNLPPSIGRLRQIIVLTNFRTQIEKPLQYALQRNYYTVQPEPEFLLRYEPLLRFNDFNKFHLIFIVGLIYEEPIQTLLKPYQQKIAIDTFGLYAFTEPWARKQRVLIFATTDLNYLERGLIKYEQRIRKEFQNCLLQYLSDISYERGYKKAISDSLTQRFNYTLKVPRSFFLNTKYASHNFVYLVAHNPTRSIFIYTDTTPMNLDPLFIIKLRDSLTNLFFDKDYVYEQFTYAETTYFNNILSLKLIGAWQNDELTAGGPFIAYCFNKDNRFYFIDGNVFNPGKRKLDNLLQLDAIIQTFQIIE